MKYNVHIQRQMKAIEEALSLGNKEMQVYIRKDVAMGWSTYKKSLTEKIKGTVETPYAPCRFDSTAQPSHNFRC